MGRGSYTPAFLPSILRIAYPDGLDAGRPVKRRFCQQS